MEHHLIVIKPFLDLVREDFIIEATRIDQVMASEYRRFVTRIAAPTTKG